MTVEEMRLRMSNREYVQWRAYYKWRNARMELEMKKTESKRRAR